MRRAKLDKIDKKERELRSARLDGHELRHHVVSAEAMSFRVSPDERWIAWQEGFQVWVSPFVDAGRTWRLGPKEEGLPRVRVSKDSGYNMRWSGDSARLHWNLGPELFERLERGGLGAGVLGGGGGGGPPPPNSQNV